MRRAAFAFALLALAAPLAAKPGAPLDPAQTDYRSQAIARCASQIGGAEGADPDGVEALCRCAADRFVAGHDVAALPAFGPAGMPSGLGAEVLRCLPEVRPEAAGAIAAAAMQASETAAPPTPDKPASTEEAAAPSGPGLLNRLGTVFDSLSVSTLPRWAWGLIALLVLLALRRLFRRPERDDDLMGAPRPDRYRDLPRY